MRVYRPEKVASAADRVRDPGTSARLRAPAGAPTPREVLARRPKRPPPRARCPEGRCAICDKAPAEVGPLVEAIGDEIEMMRWAELIGDEPRAAYCGRCKVLHLDPERAGWALAKREREQVA